MVYVLSEYTMLCLVFYVIKQDRTLVITGAVKAWQTVHDIGPSVGNSIISGGSN